MNAKERILLMLKNLVHPVGIIGIILSITIPILVYLGPNLGHKDTLRWLDLNLPLPLFAVQFILGIILLIILRKDLCEWLKSILPEKSISILALVFATVIAVFAATQIEARSRVQSDESIFFAVAQNMYYNQQSGTCNQGEFSNESLKCFATSNSFKTKGLAFLYLIGMPLLGTDLHWVFHMELLLLPLSVLLMFLAVVAWTRQPLLAFFAALLTAIQPTVMFQFRSMSVEPLYIFLSALALLIFKWAYDRNTVKHWMLLALVLAFFGQTRQETVFCFFPFILFALPKILDKKDFKAPSFFFTLSLFSVPVLITISYFQGFGFQGGEFEAHGHFLEDLSKNWSEMTKPLNKDGELVNPFLTYFNYLFALGGIYLILRAFYDASKKNYFYLKVLAFLLLYHIQTYVILENVSGDFSIQINQRYSLVMLPSMAFVGALPVAHALEKFIEVFASGNKKIFAFVSTLIVACIFAGWTAHYKEDFNKNIMYNRNHLTMEEHEIWNWLKDQPQKDRFFIYGRPWHFVGYGISSIHYDRARQMSNDELQALIDRYNGEVYYVRGLDCWDSQTYHKKAVEHRIATTCDVFEREMDLVGVKNILITNNYWLQFAKFNGRKNYNPQNIITIEEPNFEGAPEIKEANLNEVGENEDVNKVTTDTLRVKYNLKVNGEAASNWSITIVANQTIVTQEKYEMGERFVAIPEESLQPGYNHIRFLIQDGVTNKKIADVSKFYFNGSGGVINLGDLNYESHRQDWGSMQKDKSIENHALTVDGVAYGKGFGVHASSETTFNIDKKFMAFRSSFGLDDESLCSEGVRVEIWGDSEKLAETPVFKNGVLHTITARTEGNSRFTIKTIPVGSIDCSHVDIIQPVLIP